MTPLTTYKLETEIAVVGKGLFGVAAAKYLAQRGHQVILIGPNEPDNIKTHNGVFASHYDDSRIIRLCSRNKVWSDLTEQSLNAFLQLQADTGVHFYHPRPGLHLVSDGQHSLFVDQAETLANQKNIPIRRLNNLEEIRSEAPLLELPSESNGFIEYGGAGFINPRKLITAQTMAFTSAGGEIKNDVVNQISALGAGYRLCTRQQGEILASKVLVTTGAYTHLSGLLPRPLNLQTKCEHVLTAVIEPRDPDALYRFPSIVYEGQIGNLSDFYITPPIQSDKQEWVIKMGCNTPNDCLFSSADAINLWMKRGMKNQIRHEMASALRRFFPQLKVRSTQAKSCVITHSPKVLPMIGPVAKGLFIATAGNGIGAKASDAIGQLAAKALLRGDVEDSALGRAMAPEFYSTNSISYPQNSSFWGLSRPGVEL